MQFFKHNSSNSSVVGMDRVGYEETRMGKCIVYRRSDWLVWLGSSAYLHFNQRNSTYFVFPVFVEKA